MKLRRQCALLLLALLTQAAGAQVYITEFMATGGNLLDEDGDAPDWIELYNASPATINLGGWHLTDDPAFLPKWTLPATNIGPGSFLVVFASGKNRAVAGARLHTNFQLDSAGDYLALAKPDGQTIAQQFAPKFPPQIEGVSYGLDLGVQTTTFLGAGANAAWTVPLNSAGMPAGWTATNFNDTAWTSGHTGVGFDLLGTNIYLTGSATNLAPGKPTTQSSTNGSYGPQLAVDGNYGNFTHTLSGVNLPATWEVNLGANYGLERIVLWNRAANLSRLRDITVRVLDVTGTTTNFTSALLNPENVLGGGVLNLGPTNLILNLTQLTGGLVIGGRVRVTRTPDPDLSGSGGQGSTSETNVLSLAEVEVFGGPYSGSAGSFGALIQSDLAGSMRSRNATALVRLPFVIPLGELPLLDTLTLRMKYDDGFVAWLNGVEIARANAPSTPAWNSTATAEHPRAAAVQFADFDATPFAGLLQEGDNVLALQGLNLTAADADFLALPELSGQTLVPTERYFMQPTPGTTNSPAWLGVVEDLKFSVDRGFFDVPFTVAITTATAGVEIRYTTNGSPPSAVSGLLYSGPVPISRTTVLRAIGSRPGFKSSAIDTHTYVFLSDILAQNLQSVTNAGFPDVWTGTTVDYDMDPAVTGPYAAQMAGALRSLPSVFLTTSISNLFDATNGIYTHPTSHGLAWERPTSMEMLDTNGVSEFQVDCGLRIQGGAFRSFSYGQKKSLRVLFKGDYGAGKLHHDLFGEPGAAQDFDGLVFRAGGNDGYSWSSAGTTVQFTRDEFGRRLLLDMGHPSARGMFVHLYLNGLYWGLYNLTERPNEDFCATYLGGTPQEWDSVTSKYNVKSGDLQAWGSLTNLTARVATYADYCKLEGKNPDGTRNPAYPVLMDKQDYLDYMLLNIWGGNWDWPNNNYWMGRLRTAESTGFHFFAWDYENTMGNNRSRSPLDMVAPRASDAALGVGQPHYYLKNFAEYQLDFADRVQRFFFNGGLLTPQALTNRFRQLDDSVQAAIIAESARWGDDNHLPPYGLTEWLGERDWILGTYLPQRTAIVLQQFLTSGLYPAVGAPLFSQHGGAVPAGYGLSMAHTNASGVVFFTLDGSDPRVPGANTVAPAAQAWLSPLIINAPTLVRARVLSGTQWSALVEATFYPPQDLTRLMLTEIMYHPPNLGATNSDEFEFLELKNAGTNTLNLSGLYFSAGITFAFTNGATLAPGGFCVLARNAAAFSAKYPGVALGGIYTGKLDNKGERITLSEPLGATVFSVNYGTRAPWPAAADGFDFSLVQAAPGLSQAPDDGARWRASTSRGGSPGADDLPGTIPPVVINEILTHTDLPQVDAVELLNPTDDTADISGWYITDDPAEPMKYRIPQNTLLAGGARIVFDENDFNTPPEATNSFSFSSLGDSAYLFSANTNGQLTGYSHGTGFGAAFNGVSFGRHLNSAGEESFPAQIAVTLGNPNSGPRVGPVVINEIHYHPEPGGTEFVELLNVSGSAVPLFDPAYPTNTWKLAGLGFTLPAGLTLPPSGLLLVVATNPVSFRAKYSVAPAVEIVGPFPGVLQHSGERLELQAPDTPDTNGVVPYVTIDEVRYNDKAPWPAAADGTGLSLQRIQPAAYGNEPANWTAATPTPGLPFAASDTDADGLPDAWEISHGTNPFFADADADPDHDGMTNLQEYWAGTDPLDPASALQFERVATGAGSVTLQFEAMPDHTYSVLCSPGLGASAWSKFADVRAHATNRTVTITDTALGVSVRFYRLVTPAWP